MKTWFKKYWLLAFVGLPLPLLGILGQWILFKWFHRVPIEGNTYNTLVFALFGLTLIGCLGVVGMAITLGERYYAKRLLHYITYEACDAALGCLAETLDKRYAENVRLQSGEYNFHDVVVMDKWDDATKAEAYRRARKRAEGRVASDIAVAYDQFWGVANLLTDWSRRGFPKTFKECIPKRDEQLDAV